MNNAVLKTVGVRVILPNEIDSLSVPDYKLYSGDALALFGPVGSGKTTLLRVLTGFWENWEGEIYIGDAELRSISPSKSPVVLIWQDHRLFDHLTVEENALFPLRARGTLHQRSRESVRSMLAALQLADKLNSMPLELSGGQRQLVSIVRGLVACRFHKVLVLALDEPFRNLDSSAEFAARQLLRQVQSECNFATIEISHSLNSVTTVGRRIGIFDGGVCSFFDGIDDLIQEVTRQGSHLVRLELANQVGEGWRLAEPIDMISCSQLAQDSDALGAKVLSIERTALGDKVTLLSEDARLIHTFSIVKSSLRVGDAVALPASWRTRI